MRELIHESGNSQLSENLDALVHGTKNNSKPQMQIIMPMENRRSERLRGKTVVISNDKANLKISNQSELKTEVIELRRSARLRHAQTIES